MKKYIVADDGKIYDKFGIDLEKKKVGVLNCYYIEEEYCRILYEKEDFDKLKQSDTIEELCDVFVKKSKEEGNDFFDIGTDMFRIFDIKYYNYKKWFDVYDYYGAIWTDKGLIYVAKYNQETGKLELI